MTTEGVLNTIKSLRMYKLYKTVWMHMGKDLNVCPGRGNSHLDINDFNAHKYEFIRQKQLLLKDVCVGCTFKSLGDEVAVKVTQVRSMLVLDQRWHYAGV